MIPRDGSESLPRERRLDLNNRPYKKLFIPRWLLLCSIAFPPLFVVLAVLSQVKVPYTLDDLKNIGRDFRSGDIFRDVGRGGQGKTIYADFTDKTGQEGTQTEEQRRPAPVKKKKITRKLLLLKQLKL